MDRINDLFTIDNVNQGNAQKLFLDKVTELFKHCSIIQGEVEYKFLEVECYFWSETHKDNKVIHHKKENKDEEVPFVYPRKNTQPAQYFVHSSGMDLCFKSANGYGGILIRSLLRIKGENRSVVTGPWDCCDALINYTGGTSCVFPKLTYKEEKDSLVELDFAKRFNVPDGSSMKEALYCFYNKAYQHPCGKWGLKESGQPLLRYNPSTLELIDNTYSSKPWNRKP